jgi:tRNA pseudouridine38-40 synthase
MLNKNYLVFKIKADRFLRNMVRAIVGTLIEIGLGKITEEEFKLIIEKKDRQLAGFSVPAHALFLKNIDYDWDKILLNG